MAARLRRRPRSMLLVALSLVLAVGGAAWAGRDAARAATSPAPEAWTVAPDPEWEAVAVGASGRTVEIAFEDNGCATRNDHTTVRESKTAVTIEVLREILTGETICPADFRVKRLTAALAAPLAGRRVRGFSDASWSAPPIPGLLLGSMETGHGSEPLVPRLIGFAPADAKHVLKVLGLGVSVGVVHATHGLTRVVGQSPAPGRGLRFGGVVRVRVARP